MQKTSSTRHTGDRVVVQDLVYRIPDAATGDFISFYKDRCTGCGACTMVCAAGVWSIPKSGKARLSPRYREMCLECAACAVVCEQGAILFRYPNGGSGIVIQHG